MALTSEQDEKITQLFREMHDPLYSYAYSSLRNPALAEEAVQDTFRIACSKPDELLSSKNPKGWLNKTLKHVLQNIRRSLARLNSLFTAMIPVDNMVDETLERSIEFKLMCVECIGQDDFRLLEMIVMGRCSMLEASQEFGISVEACKKRVQRIKKKLRKFLEENR